MMTMYTKVRLTIEHLFVSYDSQLLWTVTNLVEDYLSDFLVNNTLPVKMFRLEIGRKRDEDMDSWKVK